MYAAMSGQKRGCSLCNVGLLGHEVDGVHDEHNGAGLIGIFPEAAAYFGMARDVHKLHWPAAPPLHTHTVVAVAELEADQYTAQGHSGAAQACHSWPCTYTAVAVAGCLADDCTAQGRPSSAFASLADPAEADTQPDNILRLPGGTHQLHCPLHTQCSHKLPSGQDCPASLAEAGSGSFTASDCQGKTTSCFGLLASVPSVETVSHVTVSTCCTGMPFSPDMQSHVCKELMILLMSAAAECIRRHHQKVLAACRAADSCCALHTAQAGCACAAAGCRRAISARCRPDSAAALKRHLLVDQHAAADILCHAGHRAIVDRPIPQLKVHGGLPCTCRSQEEDCVPLAPRKQDAQEACRHRLSCAGAAICCGVLCVLSLPKGQ